MNLRCGDVMILLSVLLAPVDAWSAPGEAGRWTSALAEVRAWPSLLAEAGVWTSALADGARLQAAHPLLFACAFAATFAVLSALALPGCGPLALLAGPAFGVVGGTLLVGAASTLGALAAFLAARHLARAPMQARFGHRLAGLERMLAGRGPWMILLLRLVPVVPFPVLNPLLGLTRMPVRDFVVPSLLGLTLGSLPYVGLGGSIERLMSHGVGHGAPLAAGLVVLLFVLHVLRRRLSGRLSGQSSDESSDQSSDQSSGQVSG